MARKKKQEIADVQESLTETEELQVADEAGEQLEARLTDSHEFLKGLTESLIFASREPLTEEQYLLVVGQRKKGKLAEIVRQLNMDYAQTGRAFEILHVAGGFQFFTRPDFSGALKKLSVERNKSRLSRAGLETLAVVAYRGPVTRGEIDDIRGVDSGGVLRTLLERRMVAVRGRADVVGRPLLYETTAEFLKHFGLSALSDLPRDSELTREWGKLQELETAERDAQADLIETDMVTDAAELDDGAHTEVRDNGHHHGHPMIDIQSESEQGEREP